MMTLDINTNCKISASFGSNQSAIRDQNERLMLTILRSEGPLPKADLARRTGLSAQAVSVITRQLESEGLLEKGTKLRGKVGQPSIPMRLASDGAYFFGLKVGRRSAELTLINFTGEELGSLRINYDFPTPGKTLRFVRDALDEISQLIPSQNKARISGLGIASPFFLWEWADVIGVETSKMASWRGFDLSSEIQKIVDFPVFFGNDATSACSAELIFGSTKVSHDFLYIYLGYFVGGGVVLNNSVYTGSGGNAGAVGPFPTVSESGVNNQLVNTASLMGLERQLASHRQNPEFTLTSDQNWHIKEPEIFEDWLQGTAPALAKLIAGACSIIDFPTIVIDGNMRDHMRDHIIKRIILALQELPLSGLAPPEILAGSLGSRAPALGAASLAVSKKFMTEG